MSVIAQSAAAAATTEKLSPQHTVILYIYVVFPWKLIGSRAAGEAYQPEFPLPLLYIYIFRGVERVKVG